MLKTASNLLDASIVYFDHQGHIHSHILKIVWTKIIFSENNCENNCVL